MCNIQTLLAELIKQMERSLEQFPPETEKNSCFGSDIERKSQNISLLEKRTVSVHKVLVGKHDASN